MKYIKLLMLVVVAAVFTACSDDDDNYNSNSVTVGFASDSYSVRETATFLDIPITVTGKLNGKVSIVVAAEEVGEHPAKEYMSPSEIGNYTITDKTLNVEADDKEVRTVNVQVFPTDDNDINENRTFKLTIVAANGAEITTSSTIVTIVDNEGAVYERFAGTWYLQGTLSDGTPLQKKVILSGTTDDTKPEYDNILTASCAGMINVGVALDMNWHFRFSFDRTTKAGTLGFICGEEVSSYSNYSWVWMTDNGTSYTSDDITASWKLGEDDSLPSEIVFPESSTLYLYQPGAGGWEYIYDLKLTR